MKLKSWERAGLDGTRAVAFAGAVGACFFAIVFVAGTAVGLGSASIVLGSMAAVGATYLIATAPRRSIGLASFRQTLEAPSMAASSNIYLRSTSSRSKTLLLLRADEPRLRSFLANVRRKVLLGYDGATAVRTSKPEGSVFSESVLGVLDATVGTDRSRVEEGSEELDGLLSAAGLDEETRLPLLIAVAFFLPIMLMLFTSVSKIVEPGEIAALVVVEVVVLDITLGLSRAARPWSRERSLRRGRP